MLSAANILDKVNTVRVYSVGIVFVFLVSYHSHSEAKRYICDRVGIA